MIRRRCTTSGKFYAVVLAAAVLTILWHYSSNPTLLDSWRTVTTTPSFESSTLATQTQKQQQQLPPPPPKPEDPWNASSVLVGDVLVDGSFRSRVKNDTYFITCWTDGGFTNAMMTYANLIYLGMISNRVPIIPPFVAWHHIEESAGVLEFSDIFDLPALKAALQTTIIEWSDIRKLPADWNKREVIGCWSAWATSNLNEKSPRGSANRIASRVGLDPSYTALPRNTRRKEDNNFDWGLLFWRIAALIYPRPSGAKSLPDGLQEPFLSETGGSMPPDNQLACFDFLYFVTVDRDDPFEWSDPWNVSWRTVGRHMRFHKRLVTLAQTYLRRAFKIPTSRPLSPFIAVHIRHGDFGGACGGETRPEDCFAPLSSYASRVKEVQAELFEKKGISIPNDLVLVTSDETDPKFWEQVVEQGWTCYDHKALGTLTTYGEWYLTLIDVVSASLSMGFVGTEVSTVSTINTKRVQEWNGGVTRMVQWGRR